MYQKLTVKADVEFDTMCEAVVEEMGDVYSNRSAITMIIHITSPITLYKSIRAKPYSLSLRMKCNSSNQA